MEWCREKETQTGWSLPWPLQSETQLINEFIYHTK
jgi:hypothetical protein